MMLEGFGTAALHHLAGRDAQPQLPFLDVSYSELTQSAERVIEQIHAHADTPLDDRAREAMRTWERDHPQHKSGVHRHSLEDFGLTPEMVDERFRPYIDRFSQCF
jgi:hypothetical protein